MDIESKTIANAIESSIDNETLPVFYENMTIMANPFSIPTVTCGILMGFVASLGIPGNIMNVYIFNKPSMGNTSISILLMSLSAIDALLLFISAPLFASSAIYVYQPSLDLMTFNAYMTAYAYPCASILQTASVWLMMLATVERYLAICFPFTARSFCTRARAKKTVVGVLIISIGYNISRFMEYQLTPVGEDDVIVALPRLRENESYMHIYVSWMYFVFIFAIPFLVLSSFNSMVLVTIRKAKRNRCQLTRQQRKEHATAALMVIVAVVYLCCNSLAFILNVMELWGVSGVYEVEIPNHSEPTSTNATGVIQSGSTNFTNTPWTISDDSSKKTTWRHSNFFYFLIDFNNLLIMIHSSVNFIIYYKFSQRFRAHAKIYLAILGFRIKSRSFGLEDTSVMNNQNSILVNQNRKNIGTKIRLMKSQNAYGSTGTEEENDSSRKNSKTFISSWRNEKFKVDSVGRGESV